MIIRGEEGGSCPVRNTGSDRIPGGPLRWDGSQKYGQGLLEFGEGGEAPSYAASECMICWSPPAYEVRHGLRSAQRHLIWRVGARDESEVLPYGHGRGAMLKWVKMRMTAVFKGSQVISKGLSHSLMTYRGFYHIQV